MLTLPGTNLRIPQTLRYATDTQPWENGLEFNSGCRWLPTRDGGEVNPSPVAASSGPDGFNVPVSLASNNRYCELRETAAEDAIGGRDYERRLHWQPKSST